VVALLLVCGSARAAVIPLQAREQAIAEEAYPQVACPVSVDLAALPSLELGVADLGTCAIHLDLSSRTAPVYVTCHTMVHEYGHLAGLEHSPDPTSVMYGILTPRATPLPCFDLDPAVSTYFFSVPGRRTRRVVYDLPRRSPHLFDLLRAYIGGRVAKEPVAASYDFGLQGVRLSVRATRRELVVNARNSKGTRASVEVYIGPAG
jgi:hypothetical protein